MTSDVLQGTLGAKKSMGPLRFGDKTVGYFIHEVDRKWMRRFCPLLCYRSLAAQWLPGRVERCSVRCLCTEYCPVTQERTRAAHP